MNPRRLGSSVIALLLASTLNVNAAPLLVDSFETANMSITNPDGFKWGSNNRTSVVTMSPGPLEVFQNGVRSLFDANSSKNWTAYTGKYSLRFRYPAGESMTEQRFSLGRHYQDVWFRYWLRVPTNFSHGGGNNKFAAFWTNVYDGSGDVTWQTRPNGGGSAKLVVQDGGTRQAEIDAYGNFINVGTDRGRWMQVVIRMKPATSSSANDGTIQFYRRWSNESQFTLLYSKTNARFYEGGQGIHEGYLMGWANNPYTVDTEWLLDDFTVAQESLLTTATTSPSTSSSPPAAPTLKVNQ
jgi:hypothetical protein